MAAALDVDILLRQLGGGAFLAMTGAKDLARDTRTLQFRIGQNPCRVNKVRIALDADDTYAMTFYQMRNGGLDWDATEVDGITADLLREIFTRHTGLETQL